MNERGDSNQSRSVAKSLPPRSPANLGSGTILDGDRLYIPGVPKKAERADFQYLAS